MFGMMPSSEVEKCNHFKVGAGQLRVTIEAGPNGWTILYADHSSDGMNVHDTTENNFNKAMELLKMNFNDINLITEDKIEFEGEC